MPTFGGVCQSTRSQRGRLSTTSTTVPEPTRAGPEFAEIPYFEARHLEITPRSGWSHWDT